MRLVAARPTEDWGVIPCRGDERLLNRYIGSFRGFEREKEGGECLITSKLIRRFGNKDTCELHFKIYTTLVRPPMSLNHPLSIYLRYNQPHISTPFPFYHITMNITPAIPRPKRQERAPDRRVQQYEPLLPPHQLAIILPQHPTIDTVPIS